LSCANRYISLTYLHSLLLLYHTRNVNSDHSIFAIQQTTKQLKAGTDYTRVHGP